MSEELLQRIMSDIRLLKGRVDILSSAVKELQSVYNEMLQLERVSNVGVYNEQETEQSPQT